MPVFWPLSLQLILAYLVAGAVKLVLLQPVLLEPSALGDGLSSQPDKPAAALTEGPGQLAWMRGRKPLFEGALDVVLTAIVCTPHLALLLHRLGARRSIYDRVGEQLSRSE